MLPWCSIISGKYITRLATTTAISSHDLDPARRAAEDVADFEILQQFAGHGRGNADHRRHAQHRRRRRRVPETPSATISSAAITSVESVRPEIGLLDEPIMPTR